MQVAPGVAGRHLATLGLKAERRAGHRKLLAPHATTEPLNPLIQRPGMLRDFLVVNAKFS